MSFSKLATIYIPSPNRDKNRSHKVIYFTPHCMVGQLSAKRCGELFSRESYAASSNYGIGTDGEIAGYVDEEDRSWCSSSAWNDNRAITVECASDTKHPYAMNEKVWDSLVNLAFDICQRYGKTKLLWFNDKQTTMDYRPKDNEMVITVHRWYAAKACVPVSSEVLTRDGWVRIDEIEIGDEIACADIDNLRITFEEIYDKVPIRRQDTYTNNDLTATKDHRMVYTVQNRTPYRIEDYKHLLNSGNQIFIPLAGYADMPGLNITDDMLRFYVAVQADGHYMYDRRVGGEKSYYGVEFHFRKERKIERIKEILEACGFEYVERTRGNGTTAIRIYNSCDVNIAMDICENFLHDKNFTWECLYMSQHQAEVFINELLFWDGCEAANIYTSMRRENLDIVNAVAAINGFGSRVTGNNVLFRNAPYISLGKEPGSTRRNSKQNNPEKTRVTCVSVKTGAFLMRQNGKTFIVGNCPGDWLYSRLGKLADEVNAMLSSVEQAIEKQVEEHPSRGVLITTEDDRAFYIWRFLKEKGLGDYAIAGLMGNLYIESALRPNNLQNSFEKKLGMTDNGYTNAVNSGKYTNFIHDKAGYGLAQWTWWSRKQALLYFAQRNKSSIDDLDMQMSFLWEELHAYTHVMKILLGANSIKEACNVVLREYERPAVVVNNDKAGITKALNARTNAGKVFYDKFANNDGAQPKTSQGFYIQYGAFGSKNNAKKRLYEVENKDLEAEISKFDGYYRVIDGYFVTAEDAHKIAVKARAAGFNVVIKERKG